jgi:hypothetical protein
MQVSKNVEVRFTELRKTSYYVISNADGMLGIRDNELGECILAWSKIHNAEMYLIDIVPLSDIQTKFTVNIIRYGELVIEAMQMRVGIIIDELPDDNWLDFIDTKGWLESYPLDLNNIKAYMKGL